MAHRDERGRFIGHGAGSGGSSRATFRIEVISGTTVTYATHHHFPSLTRNWAGNPYMRKAFDEDKNAAISRAAAAARTTAAQPKP